MNFKRKSNKDEKKRRYGIKETKGITLIALTVSIVILLILAGVSINMLVGQNGILDKASEAKRQTEDASDLEYLQTKAYESVTDYYINGKSGSETEYILKKLGEIDGITTDIIQETVFYKGKIYDVNEIVGISNEKRAIESQEGLTQITAANATSDDDKKILSEVDEDGNAKVRMIIVEEITDKGNLKAVIPGGFYYVTGKITEGLVISDKFGDDDSNSKGGNQFVWVPCNGGEITYQKHVYETKSVDDTSEPLSDTGNEKWKTYCYRKYNDWTDNENRGEKEASVKKYGGFYIARYEAGPHESADFYSNKDGATYWQPYYNEDVSEKYGDNEFKYNKDETYIDTYKIKDVTEQSNNILLPISKKNRPVWNFINQANAKIVSEMMYQKSKTVKSYLIDSVAWDTTTQWIANKGKDVTDSVEWGNYRDSLYSFSGLYARHQRKIAKDGENRLFPAYQYNYGTYTKEEELLETATGVSDRNKAQNIYDFAGNMWEWTTEEGNYNSTNNDKASFAVLRGGGDSGAGTGHPASSRHGGCSKTLALIDVGFRVVVYIK